MVPYVFTFTNVGNKSHLNNHFENHFIACSFIKSLKALSVNNNYIVSINKYLASYLYYTVTAVENCEVISPLYAKGLSSQDIQYS